MKGDTDLKGRRWSVYQHLVSTRAIFLTGGPSRFWQAAWLQVVRTAGGQEALFAGGQEALFAGGREALFAGGQA